MGCYKVGGLESVGFAPSSELILVTSPGGRSVYDCTTGKQVARDRETEDFEDDAALEAIGIGPLDGLAIRMSGLYGGGLPRLTSDCWMAERLEIDWPNESALLVHPGSFIYGDVHGKPAEFTKVFEGHETRAWGFSSTGKTLVLATSGDLTIYARK